MGEYMELALQIFVDGAWRDAGTIILIDPNAGIAGRSRFSYDALYFADFAAADFHEDIVVADRRAASLRHPVSLDNFEEESWPPFLIDLIPQGPARRRVATRQGLAEDDPALDIHLLQHAAGNPIGNIRILAAWEAEKERTRDAKCPGVTEEDILTMAPTFLDVAERFAFLASSSSGVQGEWPKVLMTQAADGLWYPDSLVDDEDAVQHVIVKMVRHSDPGDALILASEGPYMEVARKFGLRTPEPYRCGDNVIIMPRFDREVVAGQVVRHGQESLAAALGYTIFGQDSSFEDHIGAIRKASSNPVEDIKEIILRDLLSLAMGDPDNHSRNTAIQKLSDGEVRLSPFFDFAPMRLDRRGIRRSTRWNCLKRDDLTPDWKTICDAVAGNDMDPQALYDTLLAKEDFVRDLPAQARACGVPEETIAKACGRHEEIADTLSRLRSDLCRE